MKAFTDYTARQLPPTQQKAKTPWTMDSIGIVTWNAKPRRRMHLWRLWRFCNLDDHHPWAENMFHNPGDWQYREEFSLQRFGNCPWFLKILGFFWARRKYSKTDWNWNILKLTYLGRLFSKDSPNPNHPHWWLWISQIYWTPSKLESTPML